MTGVNKKLKSKLSDLAGTLNMTDKETKEFRSALKRAWEKFKIKKVDL